MALSVERIAERVASGSEKEQILQAVTDLVAFEEFQSLLARELAELPIASYMLLYDRYYNDQSPEEMLTRCEADSLKELESQLREAEQKLQDRIYQLDPEGDFEDLEGKTFRRLLKACGKRHRARKRAYARQNQVERHDRVLETQVEASGEDLEEDLEASLRLGVKDLIIAWAEHQTMRCFRQPAYQTRSTASTSEARTVGQLDHAVRALLRGEEEEVLKSDEKDGLSFRLGFETGEDGGHLTFSDLRVPDRDEEMDSFRVRFEGEKTSSVFESHDGKARVPTGAFADLLGRDYDFAIEY
jgi:hypothetical protein